MFCANPEGFAVFWLFERTMLVRNGDFGKQVNLFGRLPLIVWRERAVAIGWEVVQGLAAFATPAGDTTRSAYETLREMKFFPICEMPCWLTL